MVLSSFQEKPFNCFGVLPNVAIIESNQEAFSKLGRAAKENTASTMC